MARAGTVGRLCERESAVLLDRLDPKRAVAASAESTMPMAYSP